MKPRVTINTKEYYDIFFPIRAYKKFLAENIEVLKWEFNRLDKNTNGSIEGKELPFLAFKYAEALYKDEYKFKRIKLGKRGGMGTDYKLEDKENKKLAEQISKRIMAEYDKDRNRSIDFNEFCNLLRKVAYLSCTKANFTLPEIKKLLKKYIQAIKDFKNTVTPQQIKADTERSKWSNNAEDNDIAIGELYYYSYENIMTHEIWLLEPDIADPDKSEERRYDILENPEKHRDKIEKYIAFLEKMDQYFATLNE